MVTIPLLRRDAPFLAALLALVVACALLLDRSRPPFEDAAMLMRYAKHLASGHGIVWNVGQAPLDGATDFLFMVAVAGLATTGLRPETAVLLLGFTTHVLTVLLVYAGAVRLFAADRWVAFLTGVFLLLGPGLRYVEAGFGTPFFAFLGCLSWYFALELICRSPTRATSLLFASSALATGLTRPEGVFLGVLQLAAVVATLGWSRSREVVLHFAAVFLVLGGGYLLWRLHYFESLLPNPYYAKGGGGMHPASLRTSIGNAATLALPFLPVLAAAALAAAISFVREIDRAKVARLLRGVGGILLFAFILGAFHASNAAAHPVLVLGRYSAAYATLLALLLVGGLAGFALARLAPPLLARWLPAERPLATPRSRALADLRRWTLVAAIPVLGFTAVWLLIEDVMNYLMRFQYALLPIVCLVWPAFLAGMAQVVPGIRGLARHRAASVSLGAVLVVAFLGLQRAMMPVSDGFADGRFDVASTLKDYAGRGYTMATTEAGLLPYYSEWNAVDLFGFNDRWIARHGQVSKEYLERTQPELIVMATRFPLDAPADAPWGSWYSILGTVQRYAEDNGYALAAAFGGDPRKVHYYYVRPGFADSAELARRIREIDYVWYLSGNRAFDFAANSTDRRRE